MVESHGSGLSHNETASCAPGSRVCQCWRSAYFSVLGTLRPYLCSGNALSPPLKPFWKHAHRHTQRCVAMAILNPVKLTEKINQHSSRPHAPACIAAVSSFNKAWMFTAILWMFQVLGLQDKWLSSLAAWKHLLNLHRHCSLATETDPSRNGLSLL